MVAVTVRSAVGAGQEPKPVEERAAPVGFAEAGALLRGEADAFEGDGEGDDLAGDGDAEEALEEADGRAPLASWRVELSRSVSDPASGVAVSRPPTSTAAAARVRVSAPISRVRRRLSGLLRC
ncbi:hypothetical protein ADL12_48785 [Streptomyces regalis]|uniref:Uncharacterized protein n=1 Tax=Streptomyces regalis TaxID=68262 RepID=A0A101J5D1_9ACTN|nr:hypothetical protein ADL12_48785 [Streptomyces regalis]